MWTANKVGVGQRKLDNFPLIFIFSALLFSLLRAKAPYPPFDTE